MHGAARGTLGLGRCPGTDREHPAPAAAPPPASEIAHPCTLARPHLLETTRRPLDFAWESARRNGSGQPVMYRYHDGSPHVPGLLAAQAYMARALLDAHEVCGEPVYLERAEALARLLLDRPGRIDVLAAGPGFSRGEDQTAFVRELLSRWKHPLVLDADAIHALAGLEAEIARSEAAIVLTPHLGEMEALTGVSVALLAVYDMCKAVDKNMRITGTRLLEKVKENVE